MTTDLIVPISKAERIRIAIEMRLDGKSLDEIAERVGYCRMWVCKILKRAGAAIPTVTFDKRGSPRTKHGMRKHPTYYSWYSMKTRCGNPNHNDYKHWGGRGITYDPRWECFLYFLEDMGPRPSRKHTLERKDNEKNYCKDNCIWMLRKLQTRNQRSTKLSMEKAREIRAEYADGGTTYKALGLKHDVAATLIGGIIKGRVWKEAA